MSKMMMLRNSERSAFKTCRHKWQWTYRDGRQSATAPNALRFGDLIHRALAEYYIPGVKRGEHPATAFERLYYEEAAEQESIGFDVYSDEKWVDALELGAGMLTGYVARYAEEDAEWEIVSTEQTFQLLLRVPPKEIKLDPGLSSLILPAFRFKVVGTFDGVWRHRSSGRIVFKEFKTAAAITDDGLALDEQAGLYWTYGPKWLLKKGILKEGEMISSILYTRLRKAIPNADKKRDEMGRVLNKDGSISKQQPAAFFSRIPVYRDLANRERVHARVLDEAREIQMARAGLIPLYKNPGMLHMPNCRGCAVREACEVHECGGDASSVLAATTVPWNPYEAHNLPERS